MSGTDPVNSNVTFDDATFQAGTYTLAESVGPADYTASLYSCATNGGAPVPGNSITLGAGDDAICTITNTYTAPVVRRSSSGSSVMSIAAPIFQPSINIISTPVVVAPIIPKLPKTGFPPQESGTWYESLLNNILNLFR